MYLPCVVGYKVVAELLSSLSSFSPLAAAPILLNSGIKSYSSVGLSVQSIVKTKVGSPNDNY